VRGFSLPVFRSLHLSRRIMRALRWDMAAIPVIGNSQDIAA
jgi:hypothetical protein